MKQVIVKAASAALLTLIFAPSSAHAGPGEKGESNINRLMDRKPASASAVGGAARVVKHVAPFFAGYSAEKGLDRLGEAAAAAVKQHRENHQRMMQIRARERSLQRARGQRLDNPAMGARTGRSLASP